MKFSPKEFPHAIILLAVFFLAGKANAATCESLTRLNLPHAKITQAQFITGGSFTPPGSPMELKDLPPFCRVTLTSSPTPDSLINIEVWIPVKEAWNGKYLQAGCGGFCGTVQYQYIPLARAIRRGYASAAADAGNQLPGEGNSRWGIPRRSSISATAA